MKAERLIGTGRKHKKLLALGYINK